MGRRKLFRVIMTRVCCNALIPANSVRKPLVFAPLQGAAMRLSVIDDLHALGPGRGRLFIHRDDLAHPLFCGNKARILGGLFNSEEMSGVELMHGSGSADSSALRFLAFEAFKRGIACRLFVNQPVDSGAARLNLSVLRNLKVDLSILPTKEIADSECADAHGKAGGGNSMLVSRGGFSAAGAVGYSRIVQEVGSEIRQLGIDHLLIPVGTGTSLAGLLWGLAAANIAGIQVTGVLFSQPEREIRMRVATVFADLKGDLPEALGRNRIHLAFHDARASAGKAGSRPLSTLLMRQGIFLDANYNAPAVDLLPELINTIGRKSAGNFLYFNTGGLPTVLSSLS